MRLPDEGHHHIPLRRFLQHHFGMAGSDDLGVRLGGDGGEQVINVPLPEDLQVGVRLVQQQHRAGVGQQMAQQQQHLLAAGAGRRYVQFHTPGLTKAQGNFAPFPDEDWS